MLGDSKLLIDWENGKCRPTHLALGPIVPRVLEVKLQFEFISFSHIYREFNSKADTLSKDALSLQEGTLLAQEFRADLLSENLCSIF